MNSFKIFTKSGLLASFVLLFFCQTATAAIFVKYDGVDGESITIEASKFKLDAAIPAARGHSRKPEPGSVDFSFLRSNKTLELLQRALNSQGFSKIVIELTEVTANGAETTYLRYKLSRCFVKSWSTSGDADDRPTEEIAFYYTKIDFD